MLKIYTKHLLDAINCHKNGKIEDNLENVEDLLNIIENITGKAIWKDVPKKQGKIVIELSLDDENTDRIMEIIKQMK